MKRKKHFGQHFLVNEYYAQQLAEAISEPIKNILEVGPGMGVLTQYLMARPSTQLKAVEIDRDLIEYLAENYPSLSVFSGDFIRMDMEDIFGNEEYALAGNFPYNISSQIVFKAIENRTTIPELVGMFQLEMAERILAPHGNKTYGVISVLTQAYFDGEMLFKVSPGNFSPPPKVNSAVIKLKRKEKSSFENVGQEKLFKRIVKTAFQQRRKMLRNTLKGLGLDHLDLEDPYYNQRPEDLSVKDFIEMTKFAADNCNNQKI